MARSGSTVLRLAFAVLAVAAIVAMHGSSAEAHACDHAGHAMAAHEHDMAGMAGMPGRPDPAEGPDQLHGDADMHGRGAVSAHGSTHARHAMPGHRSTHTTESPATHCGPMACTALVAPSPAPLTVRTAERAAVHPDHRLPMVGTSAAPEPPVPRSSLRT